jgi:hypothetical protein
MSRMRWGSWSS